MGASRDTKFFQSADRGDSWEARGRGLPRGYHVVGLAALERGDETTVLLAGWPRSIDEGSAAYVTDGWDRGWLTLRGLPFIWSNDLAQARGDRSRAWVVGSVGDLGVAVVGADRAVELLPTDGLPGFGGLPQALAVWPGPRGLALAWYYSDDDVGMKSGVYVLGSDERWSALVPGLPDEEGAVVRALGIQPETGDLLAGVDYVWPLIWRGGHGIYRWRASRGSWDELDIAVGGAAVTFLAADEHCPDRAFIGTTGGGVRLEHIGE